MNRKTVSDIVLSKSNIKTVSSNITSNSKVNSCSAIDNDLVNVANQRRQRLLSDMDAHGHIVFSSSENSSPELLASVSDISEGLQSAHSSPHPRIGAEGGGHSVKFSCAQHDF